MFALGGASSPAPEPAGHPEPDGVARTAQAVVGLGNPGPEYASTRHNVGQAVVDRLAQRLGGRFRRRGQAVAAQAERNGARLHLVKPLAFMNVVGPAVARVMHALGLQPAQLLVVHDDLDLPFGRVRFREQGGHGGHNGVRSLIEALGTENFRRVKVGIGRPASREPPGQDGTSPEAPGREAIVDWVLSPFDPEEDRALPEILDRAADLTVASVDRGGRP